MGETSERRRYQNLQQTPSVALGRFDHPYDADLSGCVEEPAEHYWIHLIERGWFQLGYRKKKWTLGPGSIFVGRPNEVHTYAHFRRGEPDVCLSVKYSAAGDRDLIRTFEGFSLVIPATNRISFVRLQLCSPQARQDSLLLETLAYDLVAGCREARTDRHRHYQPQQLMWYAERIRAVRETLDTRFAEPQSLQKLAESVAMSPFQCARIFRELIGIPPHRYLLRVRLAHACAMLKQGSSVTNACYYSGFNDLSHFIHTFKAHFGYAPSRMKSLPRQRSKSLPMLTHGRNKYETLTKNRRPSLIN